MSELKYYEYSDTQNPKYLVILLHGYGANGENLLTISNELKSELPDAHYIAPNGVEPWEGGFPDSYQWFSLSNGFERRALEDMADNIKNANNILTHFIDAQLARFNLTDEKLIIIGFSQGAMIAKYQGFTRPRKPAGVIAFSGRLILPETLGEKTLSKPKICLIHGEDDSVVSFDNFLETKKTLESEEISHESHGIPGLDHSIDINGIRIAQNFIKKITT